MIAHKTKLECPRCHWIFEPALPEAKHWVYSLEKPSKNIIQTEITETKRVCRNPKCKEPITVYSYEP